MRRCEGVRVLVARDRQGMLYRSCENYKHRDMLIGSQTQTHTEKHVYTYIHRHEQIHTHAQKLLHTETFRRKSIYAEKILAQTLSHFYTHTRCSTQNLSHTEAFTHRSYTEAFTPIIAPDINNCTRLTLSIEKQQGKRKYESDGGWVCVCMYVCMYLHVCACTGVSLW